MITTFVLPVVVMLVGYLLEEETRESYKSRTALSTAGKLLLINNVFSIDVVDVCNCLNIT